MDKVKSMAMLRLISQPPNTYSRKFTDFCTLKLITLMVDDFAFMLPTPGVFVSIVPEFRHFNLFDF